VLSDTAGKALTCLAAAEDCFLTGSFDGVLRLYRTDGRAAVKTHRASAGVTTCAISSPFEEDPERGFRLLACGCTDGSLQVLNEWDMQTIYERQVSQTKAPLLCSAFSGVSPDQNLWLAIGGQDSFVYCTIFPRNMTEDLSGVHQERRPSGNVAVKGPVFKGHGGHGAPVVAVQFSSTVPPQVLASVGMDGQIICYDLAGGRRLPSARFLVDMPFEPYTLPLGPLLEGLWENELTSTAKLGQELEKVRNTGASIAGSGVTPASIPERYVMQAPDRPLLAISSPETNEIRLAELPVTYEGVRYRAHGARITGMAWCGNETLVSITSSRTIARWRVGPGREQAKPKAFAPPSRVKASPEPDQSGTDLSGTGPIEFEKENDANGTATVNRGFLEDLGVSPKPKVKFPPGSGAFETDDAFGNSLRSTGSNNALSESQPYSRLGQSGPLRDTWSSERSAPAGRVGSMEGPARRGARFNGEEVESNVFPLGATLDSATASLHDWTQPPRDEDVGNLDGYAGPLPRNLQIEAKRKTREFVSPKIGSKVAAQTDRSNDFYDAHQAALSHGVAITERNKRSSGVMECLTSQPELGTFRSIAADPELRTKFKHTSTVAGSNFDVEVKLGGGSLSMVRADLGQNLIYVDGIADGAPERLVVRVPAGYDLGGRLRTVKKYEDGYLRVLIPRESIHKTSREGVMKI
jgi:WD40 repeat protein